MLRNKRNIALDIKVPEGMAAFSRLLASSDVFITNLRPEPLARLSGSGDYTLRQDAGQDEWRRCTQCQGLFFNGGGALGRCPSKATTHQPASDDYFVPYGG